MTRKEAPELTPEQWAVVKANLRLVDEVIFKHFNLLAKRELRNLQALGTVGLEDAVRVFDPSKSTLRTFAWMRIRGAILNGMERESSCLNDVLRRARLCAEDFAARKTEGLAQQDDAEQNTFERFREGAYGFMTSWRCGWLFGGRGDDIETSLQRGARMHLEKEALAAVDTLPVRDRQMIKLRYLKGLTWPEVASETGIPEGTLYHHHHSAMKRLHARLREHRVDPAD